MAPLAGHYRSAVRNDFNIPPDAPVILNVGKLASHKCQRDILLAARQLQGSGYEIHTIIVGDGPDRIALEAVARQDGIRDVHFAGFQQPDDLPKFYMAADIYIHPSRLDPHPLAISEAIYFGLPIVVSDRVGSIGTSDDVQVGRNGWVYKCNDVQALSRLMMNLLTTPEQVREAGEQSRLISDERRLSSSIKGYLHAVRGSWSIT